MEKLGTCDYLTKGHHGRTMRFGNIREAYHWEKDLEERELICWFLETFCRGVIKASPQSYIITLADSKEFKGYKITTLDEYFSEYPNKLVAKMIADRMERCCYDFEIINGNHTCELYDELMTLALKVEKAYAAIRNKYDFSDVDKKAKKIIIN